MPPMVILNWLASGTKPPSAAKAGHRNLARGEWGMGRPTRMGPPP